jgi:hypothetical protein
MMMFRIQRWIGPVALAAIALPAAAVFGNSAALSTRAAAAESFVCMTDDGYGRMRPCSAGYMASNPNWRGGESCFTDDGYGRYRPCSAGPQFKSAPVKGQEPEQPPQQK